MDFLDSLDLETSHRKSNRVRSWYLYEQFKSLKRMDATPKLDDKSHQEKILRQELSERKARRNLFDQFGLSQSESRIARSIRSDETKSTLSASNDDFLSFCEANEDDIISEKCECTRTYSVDDLSPESDNKSPEELKDEDLAYKESFESVIENIDLKTPVNECVDMCAMKEEGAIKCMANNINEQLESLRANFHCLEMLTSLDTSGLNENELVHASSSHEFMHAIKHKQGKECNNWLTLWSRLVSFAFQFVQLNHGNCYCDYSSQLLTAVLACDVLRRGVNKMCRMLQPYVSPITLASDESDVSSIYNKKQKRKKYSLNRKCCKRDFDKRCRNRKCLQKTRTQYTDFKSDSERCWKPMSHHSSYYDEHCPCHVYDPNVARRSPRVSQGTSTNTVWPRFSKENLPKSVKSKCSCTCHTKAINPMLKIARYIDNKLKEVDDYL